MALISRCCRLRHGAVAQISALSTAPEREHVNQGAGNEWVAHAARLAGVCAEFDAGWADIVGKVPRHNFVPRWFEDGDREWRLHDGPSDPQRWMDAAYSPRSLVTRVGGLHADLCSGPTAVGGPTSAITDAREVVVMLRSGEIKSDSQVLCVAGSGYTAALLSTRIGDKSVTAIDIDPYLVSSATEHLASIGLGPVVQEYSITGDLPGEFDRIISTVSVRPIPQSWLSALRPGGRLVTSIAGTSLLVTANKTEDGGAAGMIERVDAAFMAARGGEDEPDEALNALFEQVRDQDGEQVTTSRFPVPVGPLPWDLRSMLELCCPGSGHYSGEKDGHPTLWLVNLDGSWARLSGPQDAPAQVHQGGPRRLGTELEAILGRRGRRPCFPVHGASVTITPDGVTTLVGSGWKVTL